MHEREIRIATPDGDMTTFVGEGLTFDFTKAADETCRARLMEVVSNVTPDAALADIEAVPQLAADDPATSDGPAVCVGYCTGAKVALHAASALPQIEHSATEERVDRFRQEGVDSIVERIGGVSHGFAMADLPVYEQAATERHFERTLDLWRRSLSAERLGA